MHSECPCYSIPSTPLRLSHLQEAKKRTTEYRRSERAGLVKDDEVTRISESDKRGGLALYVYRRGELIRENIARDSKASIKFFIFARHKSTKIDYLVPVNFRVDFKQMTTSLVLDETRI